MAAVSIQILNFVATALPNNIKFVSNLTSIEKNDPKKCRIKRKKKKRPVKT